MHRNLINIQFNMKQVTLNIEESKFKTFLDLISKLEYVSVQTNDNDLLIDEQIAETEYRLSLLKNNKLKKRSWEEAKKEIFQK